MTALEKQGACKSVGVRLLHFPLMSSRSDQAAYHRAWREAHPDYYVKYRAKNREKHKAYFLQWQRDHPEQIATYQSVRRARKAGGGGSHTTEERQEKFAALGGRCYYCGLEGLLTIDHLTPLSRGGTDDINNIVPACKPCNSRKGRKTEEEYNAYISAVGVR